MWNTAAEKLLQRTNLFQETLSGQPFTSEANASNLKKILYSPENNKMEDEPEFDITLAMAQQALSIERMSFHAQFEEGKLGAATYNKMEICWSTLMACLSDGDEQARADKYEKALGKLFDNAPVEPKKKPVQEALAKLPIVSYFFKDTLNEARLKEFANAYEIRRAYLIAQEAYVHAVLHDDHHAHDDHHGNKHHGGAHPPAAPEVRAQTTDGYPRWQRRPPSLLWCRRGGGLVDRAAAGGAVGAHERFDAGVLLPQGPAPDADASVDEKEAFNRKVNAAMEHEQKLREKKKKNAEDDLEYMVKTSPTSRARLRRASSATRSSSSRCAR